MSYEHGILANLLLPLTEETSHAVHVLYTGDDHGYFKTRGRTSKEIMVLDRSARQRSGVLLAFTKDIQNDPSVSLEQGDPGEGDICIRPGSRGLSYKHISGIEPLGEIEENLLRELLK